MKKLLTLLLIAIVSVGYAQQTKTVTPHGDTVLFTPAKYNAATFTTTSTSALFQQGNFTQAVMSIIGGGTITPPVNPPPPPPPTNPGAISLNGLVDGVMPAAITQPSYTASGAINVSNVNGKRYSGLIIDMKGSSTSPVHLTNCKNDTIVFCAIKNSTSPGIYLSNCVGIVVMYDYFTNVSTGVYQENCTNAGTMIIALNQFKNMIGPLPRGQFVQMNTTTNCTGCVIGWNRGENFSGSSNPEDTYNLYKSSGTTATPIKITTNWIRGGGPSKTGGGIMMGDNGGSYQTAMFNILVNPGQYGMSISGGDHMSIINNQIFASKQSFTNVGIYIWPQAGAACSFATVSGNQVNWTKSDGTANADWDSGSSSGFTTCGTISGWNTNTWSANISTAILPTNILTWQ